MARVIITKSKHGNDRVELRSVLMPNGEKRDYSETGLDAFKLILNQIMADKIVVIMMMRLERKCQLALPAGTRHDGKYHNPRKLFGRAF